jgi:hypothetical protein
MCSYIMYFLIYKEGSYISCLHVHIPLFDDSPRKISLLLLASKPNNSWNSKVPNWE